MIWKIYIVLILVCIVYIFFWQVLRGKTPFKWKNYYMDIGEEESGWFIEMKELKKKKNGNKHL